MRRWATRLGAMAVPVMLVIGWVLFAPAQVGGRATYLMTEGVSMLPTYHGGDLVVLHREATYEIGDVIAYADPNIGEVFHRIVGREGDKFVMKGDNNSHEDVFRPTPSEILGRLWLSIPGGGNLLLAARQPPAAAGLSGGAVLLATLPIAGKVRGRRRLLRKRPDAPSPQGRPGNGGGADVLGPVGQVTAMLVALATAIAIGGLILGFSQPLDRQVGVNLKYAQSGRFDYAAANAPLGVYDSGTAQTGDPIYRRLTPAVSFRFDYRFASTAPAELSGTAALHAELRAPNGWTRVVPLQGPGEFKGNTATVSGTLDLNQVQSMIDLYHQQTGTGSSDPVQFNLDIVPVIKVGGSLGGTPMAQTYAPVLSLQYGYDQMSMSQAALPTTGSSAASIEPSSDGLLASTVTEPNTLNLLLVSPAVATVRTASLLELPAAALLILLLVALGLRARSADESVRIQARYAHLIVALRGSAIADSGQTFDVETIEDLVRVADREGRMVLHETRGSDHPCYVQDAAANYRCSEHIYYVQDADATYRYRTVDRPITESSALAEVTT